MMCIVDSETFFLFTKTHELEIRVPQAILPKITQVFMMSLTSINWYEPVQAVVH